MENAYEERITGIIYELADRFVKEVNPIFEKYEKLLDFYRNYSKNASPPEARTAGRLERLIFKISTSVLEKKKVGNKDLNKLYLAKRTLVKYVNPLLLKINNHDEVLSKLDEKLKPARDNLILICKAFDFDCRKYTP